MFILIKALRDLGNYTGAIKKLVPYNEGCGITKNYDKASSIDPKP